MKQLLSFVRQNRFESSHLRKPLTAYRYRSLEPADAILATYPRSGTTWMKFMLFEVLSKEPADFPALRTAIPYVGQRGVGRRVLTGGGRIVQSHEPYFTGDHRVLHVVRDPRSVVVSLYYWLLRRGQVRGTLDEFVPRWIAGKGTPWGSWATHAGFWLGSSPAREGRLRLVRYEDLQSTPHEEMESILEFLGVPRSPAEIGAAVENNTVERMQEKESKAAGMQRAARPDIPFVRKGSTSGWKEELSQSSEVLIMTAYASVLPRLGYQPGDTGAGVMGQ